MLLLAGVCPPRGAARCVRRPALLARPGQLGPRGVKVALGALGAGAQLAARLLEHLGAGFQRGAQFLALACRVGAQLRRVPRRAPGHLGQAVGGVGEPGEDLVPLPLVVGAYLAELTRGVGPGPRGFCACVLGPRVGGRGALVGLRGLREGLVPGVIGGADKGLGLGPGLLDRLLRLRLRAARALLGRGDALGLVRLGAVRSRCPGLPRRW